MEYFLRCSISVAFPNSARMRSYFFGGLLAWACPQLPPWLRTQPLPNEKSANPRASLRFHLKASAATEKEHHLLKNCVFGHRGLPSVKFCEKNHHQQKQQQQLILPWTRKKIDSKQTWFSNNDVLRRHSVSWPVSCLEVSSDLPLILLLLFSLVRM